MPVPAVAGLCVADVALCILAGLPHVFAGDAQQTPSRAAAATRDSEDPAFGAGHAKRVLSSLVWRETKRSPERGAAAREALSEESVLYAVRDVWGCRSALSGRELKPKEVVLALYDAEAPASRANVVVVAKDELEALEHRGERPLDEEVARRIAAKLAALNN
eukprot:m51a1_g12291 hypothetical protein (162) ;mRNA; f:309319-309804